MQKARECAPEKILIPLPVNMLGIVHETIEENKDREKKRTEGRGKGECQPKAEYFPQAPVFATFHMRARLDSSRRAFPIRKRSIDAPL